MFPGVSGCFGYGDFRGVFWVFCDFWGLIGFLSYDISGFWVVFRVFCVIWVVCRFWVWVLSLVYSGFLDFWLVCGF